MKKYLLLDARDSQDKHDAEGNLIRKQYFIEEESIQLKLNNNEIFSSNAFLFKTFLPIPSDKAYRNIEFALSFLGIENEKKNILEEFKNYEKLKVKNLANMNQKMKLKLELKLLNMIDFNYYDLFIFNYGRYSNIPYSNDATVKLLMESFIEKNRHKFKEYFLITKKILKRQWSGYENDFDGFGFIYDDSISVTDKDNFLKIYYGENN